MPIRASLLLRRSPVRAAPLIRRSIMSTSNLPRDVLQFIEDYPGQRDSNSKDNLHFYQNTLRSRPDGKLVEEIHSDWKGEYDTLESKHGFIQWLFPIQENGMNWESVPLERSEIDSIRGDAAIRERFLASYRLILDFFGMDLADEETGRLQRNESNYELRYKNLNRSSHNYLRISRIMKSLIEFGLDDYPAAFIMFVLHEQSDQKQLTSKTLLSSMDRWWVNCNRNKKEREALNNLVAQVRAGGVLTYDKYEQALEDRKNGKSAAEWAKL